MFVFLRNAWLAMFTLAISRLAASKIGRVNLKKTLGGACILLLSDRSSYYIIEYIYT